MMNFLKWLVFCEDGEERPTLLQFIIMLVAVIVLLWLGWKLADWIDSL